MLTSLDDSLWHQLPTTFDHVGTSDPRFFDRYWFACYAPDGSAAMQFTMGAYRNMNVLDGGAVVVYRGKQYNVRVSRSLGREIDTVCGPLTVQTTEPLQEFELEIAPGDHGVSGHIVWRGVVPAAEERPHFSRSRGRVAEDYQRFDQIGVAQGWVDIDGERIDVADWWACRDHSWGVRPRIGVKEPVTGEKQSLNDNGFAMAFLFFSTDDYAGHIQFNGRGENIGYVTGDVRRRSDGEVGSVSGTDLQVELHPGTRRFRECTMRAELPEGKQLSVRCSAHPSSIAMQGLGYSGGYDDRAGLGVWRGEEHLEYDVWDVSDPAKIVYPGGGSNEHWHRITPVSVAIEQDGAASSGTGSMTLILSGRLPTFGLS